MNFIQNHPEAELIIEELQTARFAYLCFCNPHNLDQHFDAPRLIFTKCQCAGCYQKGLDYGDDIHNPVLKVVLTEETIEYIFNSSTDKDIHNLIPQKVFQAFTDCAVAYGNSYLDWATIVDLYDDMHPENIFSASHLENYFLQLALLITFPELKDQ
ncbi:MAG: hypothetical protein ACO3UU_13905 [Minisyncoccia bacterium]